MERLSLKQIKVISDFGEYRYRIHVGPYGCGKSYSLTDGLGLWCKTHKPGRLGILIVAKSAALARSTIGDELSNLFGADYEATRSRKIDDKSKDALLFGHRLYFGGMDNKESIKRILGKSYKGILCDELTSLSREHFELLQGRLRGDPPHWFEGSCNPQAPSHWLKRMLDEDNKNRYHCTRWYMSDNKCSWAPEYYAGLMEQYRNMPAYLDRYVYGEWSAADNQVYGDTFDPKTHIIPSSELEGAEYKYFKVGVDFGMENPTVALICGVMPEGEHIILDEVYMPHAKNLDFITGQIINAYNKYTREIGKCMGLYIDPSASVLIKGLKTKGLTCVKKANNNVIEGIASVNTMLSSGRLYFSENCVNLINELYSYAYSDKEGEIVKKVNDHCVDALRYLIYIN